MTVAISEAELIKLRERLTLTRWPEAESVADWSQGVPLTLLRPLCEYWQTHYDWRRCETMLNHFDNRLIDIDGLPIHFLHARSPHPGALPLIITHGWPGAFLEFLAIIPALTEPEKYGGRAEDAFHVVLPSLPGFGFSGKPKRAGWGVDKIAAAWASLMTHLGYGNYMAQGGDWGAVVSNILARDFPSACTSLHLTMAMAFPDGSDSQALTMDEQEILVRYAQHRLTGTGYASIQSTRPQTIGYGLVDSPAALAAWIFEKLAAWSDCGNDPESIFGRDAILDLISLYWFTGTGASAARLYWESYASLESARVSVPTGISLFPHELYQPPRRWVERCYNLVYWSRPQQGGHFAAWEQPEQFVKELWRFRSCLAQNSCPITS